MCQNCNIQNDSDSDIENDRNNLNELPEFDIKYEQVSQKTAIVMKGENNT